MQESPIDNWAIRHGIAEPESVYHANETHLGSTDARLFLQCPAKYNARHLLSKSKEDSADMFIGRAAHKLLLEGQAAFDDVYTVGDGPINPTTKKPYKRDSQKYAVWAKKQPKIIMSIDEADRVDRMRDAAKYHDIAAEILTEGVAERVFRGGEFPQCPPIQARVDWCCDYQGQAAIVDFKTTRDLDRFDYEITDRGYAFQLAWYRKAIELASEGFVWPTAAYIIAVDKTEPYRCGVWDMSINMERCADEVGECLKRYLDCAEKREWPSRYDTEVMYHTP